MEYGFQAGGIQMKFLRPWLLLNNTRMEECNSKAGRKFKFITTNKRNLNEVNDVRQLSYESDMQVYTDYGLNHYLNEQYARGVPMKKLLIGLLALVSISTAFGRDLKKEVIGQKACAYETVTSKEVCMRDFREYGSIGKNSLEIILRACIYAVGGDHYSCILGLIGDNDLIYEPTKSQLHTYLEYKLQARSNVIRSKCHFQNDISDCLEREINSFIQSAEVFKVPLKLPRIID